MIAAAPILIEGHCQGEGGTIEVRPPSRGEMRACRMLLPEAFRIRRPPDLLLAAGSSPLRYLGVLSYDLVHHGGRLGWRVAVHVARAARRRGVGPRLIAEIASRGRRRGAAFLLAEVDAEEQPGCRDFLAACGFRTASRCTSYEGDLAHYRSVIGRDPRPPRGPRQGPGRGPRRSRRARRPHEALDRLAAARIAASFQPVDDLSADFWRRPSVRDSSAILMLGDRAIGGIVAEAFGDAGRRALALRSIAEFRGGWANVILSAGSGDRLAALGVRRVRFSTTEETPDTENGVRIHGYRSSPHRRAPPAGPHRGKFMSTSLYLINPACDVPTYHSGDVFAASGHGRGHVGGRPGDDDRRGDGARRRARGDLRRGHRAGRPRHDAPTSSA